MTTERHRSDYQINPSLLLAICLILFGVVYLNRHKFAGLDDAPTPPGESLPVITTEQALDRLESTGKLEGVTVSGDLSTGNISFPYQITFRKVKVTGNLEVATNDAQYHEDAGKAWTVMLENVECQNLFLVYLPEGGLVINKCRVEQDLTLSYMYLTPMHVNFSQAPQKIHSSWLKVSDELQKKSPELKLVPVIKISPIQRPFIPAQSHRAPGLFFKPQLQKHPQHAQFHGHQRMKL